MQARVFWWTTDEAKGQVTAVQAAEESCSWEARVVWLDHYSPSPNYARLEQKQDAEKALRH